MKINHAIKKIAAVGTGAMMLGMSAAAVSGNLADYPAPFIQDGQFSGSFVVGEAAATTDVIGAIELATSLQAAATTPVYGDGQDGETVLEDAFRVASGSSSLLYGQDLNLLRNSITEDDLGMLRTATFQDDSGTNYDVEFRVNMPDAAVTWARSSRVTGSSGDDPAFYVDFETGSPTWSFDMIFPDSINLDDFTGESIEILGETYTFGQDDEVSNEDQLITLYKSSVDVTVEAGSPQTVVVGGEQVTIDVAGALTDDRTAQVVINGQSRTVEEGRFYTIGGERVYVDDVFVINIPTQRAAVRLFLGAEKIVLEEGRAVQREDAGNSDDVLGTLVSFTGGGTPTDPVTQVRVTYTPRNHESIFSEGVNQDRRGLLLGEEYVDPVFGQIKFAFTDRVPSPTSATKEVMEFYPSGTEEFSVKFENFNGQEYDFVLLRQDGTNAELAYGSDPSEIYVLGANWDSTAAAGAGDLVDNGLGDYVYLETDNRFVLRGIKASGDPSEYTRVLELQNVRESSTPATIRLRDIAAGGQTREFSASGSVDLDAAGNPLGSGVIGSVPFGTFTYDGFAYGFLIVDADTVVLTTPVENAAPLADPEAVENVLVTRRGAEITLPQNDLTGAGSYASAFEIEEDTEFNGNVGAAEAGTILIDLQVTGTGSDNRIRVDDVDYSLAAWSGLQQMRNTNDDLYLGTTVYGTLLQWDSDSSGGDLTVFFPREQVHYNVFVGPASAGTSTGGGESGVIGEVVAPINVGAAILDREAAGMVGNSNLLVVGGPCVNTVAAQLMGNPADCTADFTQGSAMLKVFPNAGGTVSLLVAGYSGADTRLAARVLANYAQYEGQLVGDEVVVSGTTIDNVDISAPTVTSDDS